MAALWLGITLALATMAGPATILAAPKPTVTASAIASPPTVSHGAYVVFDVSLTNSPNPSNFAQFFMTADTPDEADLVAVVQGPSQGTCDASGDDLNCTFGALNSGATVTFSVVYLTPTTGSSMSVQFLFTSTGSTGSDTPGRSHGDVYPVTGTVNLLTSDDFSGGYLYTGVPQTIADNQTFSRRNPQWTAVNAPESGIGVAVGELADSGPACPGESAPSCFGQWSTVYVAGGNVYADGFTIQIGYDASKPNANFAHVFDRPYDGITFQLIKSTCSDSTPEPSELPCKIVTISGGDTFVTLWVKHNGLIHGY
jgi:hypothetical protein